MEKTVKEELIYQGKILNLKRHHVVLNNGVSSLREIVEHNGAVAILAEENGKILFVRQYRKAFEDYLLEIPAGKLEKAEIPLDCAKRELEEETGLIAGKFVLMQTIYPSPGFCNEIIYLYKASDFSKGKSNPDEDEELSVEWISKKDVESMVKEGKFNDGKTLIALLSVLAGIS